MSKKIESLLFGLSVVGMMFITIGALNTISNYVGRQKPSYLECQQAAQIDGYSLDLTLQICSRYK